MAAERLTGREPGVRDMIRRCYPDYRGRKLRWEARETLHLSPTYWDGGTCHEYVLYELASGQVREVPRQAPREMGGPDPDATVPLRPGFAVLEHVFFCGQDIGVRVYVHPEDAPKLLTERSA